MRLSGTYSIAAPRERVFAAITDPAVLQRCIEGCEKMIQTGPENYEAHLEIGVAGLKGHYVGKIQLKDQKPPESYTLIVEGKSAAGFVKGTAQIQLVEQGTHTELRCAAEAQVGGLFAAIGSRLIEAAAKRMMEEFFQKFGVILKDKRSGSSSA